MLAKEELQPPIQPSREDLDYLNWVIEVYAAVKAAEMYLR